MAKPWKKQWPYVTKSGEKSYRVGFRDHDGIGRTKAFPSAKIANEWTQEYVSAERRGSHSLRRFLLDLDARDASGDNTGQTIGEVIQLYFAFNAPETADGLSASTFRTYRHSANRHLLGMPGMDKGKARPPASYAVRFAAQPATTFNEPEKVGAEVHEAIRRRSGQGQPAVCESEEGYSVWPAPRRYLCPPPKRKRPVCRRPMRDEPGNALTALQLRDRRLRTRRVPTAGPAVAERPGSRTCQALRRLSTELRGVNHWIINPRYGVQTTPPASARGSLSAAPASVLRRYWGSNQ